MTYNLQQTTYNRTKAGILGRVVSRRLLVVGWRGLSLIEILIVIAIMLILATMLGTMLSSFNSVQQLRVGVNTAASVFERARNLSLVGEGGVAHGVHIGSTTLTLFEGSTYDANSASNETVGLMGSLEVAAVTLAGGLDVIFAPLAGTTTNTGTLVFQVGSDSSRQRTVTISGSGVVSVQ